MLTSFDKAIAGGIVSAILTVLGHYGFQPQGTTVTALGVVVTALVGYVVGHLAVYFAKNRPLQTS